MNKVRRISILFHNLCFVHYRIWTSIFILLIPTSASAQQKFPLVFSPSIGDKLIYTMNTSVQAEGKDLSGMDISVGVTASGEISFDVKRKIPDRVFTGLTTPGIQVEVETLEGPQLYSLKTKANMALQAAFDPRGSLHEIHNLKAFNREKVMNISLVQILRDYFPVLPGKPVAIGEIWIDNKRINLPFQEIDLEILIETKYALQNVIPSAQGDVAVISMDYEVRLSGSKSLGEWTSSFEGKGAGGGLLNFLIQRGCFQEFWADYQTKAALVIKKEGKPLMEWPFHLSIFASAIMTN
jgi:hypothetical protein